MNPGNIKPRPPKPKANGVDNFIERLNKGFGKLLGRRDNSPPPKETSNTVFSVIIFGACLLLWLCTGFYFLGENEYGLILTNGKIVDVKRGIKVGLTLPYPFGSIEIIDAAPSTIMTIGDNLAKTFTVLDVNLLPVSVIAKFSYQIDNPKILYQNHLQNQDAFDTEILWRVQSNIRNIIATKSFSVLDSTNLTVLTNEISGLLTSALSPYGIKLNKFTIVSIQKLNSEPSAESKVAINQTARQPISVQLLAQAALYNSVEIAEAITESKEFDQLLPVYRKNSSQTVTRMYYDMLNKIPVPQTDNKYNLLFLNLKNLKQNELTGFNGHSSVDINERVFTREVTRDRSWMGD